MNELKKLTNSFEETLKDSDLQNVTIGIIEALTDSIINDGIVKDIPIIGTIVGLSKTSMTIKDRLFLKKIIHFITKIKDVNIIQRNEIITKIDSSKKFRIKVGEKLFYIIDKCEDHITAEYIAILFNAFLNKKLTYSEFLRSSFIVQKIFIDDLQYFIKSKYNKIAKVKEFEEDFTDTEINLINVGLCMTNTENIYVRDQDDWKMRDKYVVEGGRKFLCLTEIGKKIKTIMNTNSTNPK